MVINHGDRKSKDLVVGPVPNGLWDDHPSNLVVLVVVFGMVTLRVPFLSKEFVPKVWSLVSNNDQGPKYSLLGWEFTVWPRCITFSLEGSRVMGNFPSCLPFFCCGNAAGGMNGTFIFWISWFEAFKGLKQRVFFFHGIQSLSFKDCFPYESWGFQKKDRCLSYCVKFPVSFVNCC